jgi:hypothetical protein
MFIESKYVELISPQLRNFKKTDKTVYNFSCPICGDSKRNKRKARGYVYEKGEYYIFHCHNCSVSMPFAKFLKEIDETVYKEYLFEKFQNKKYQTNENITSFTQKMKAPKFLDFEPLKKLKKVSSLPITHPIKKYVVSRKIPNNQHFKLFECPNFKGFINEIIPHKFACIKNDETRLLIPFIDSNKKVHALQGRSMKSSLPKYITIILDETVPKIYGLDTVKFSDKVFVFEGPIDSMFIENSIATAGGDIVSVLDGYCKEKLTVVYDNEPRSIETIKKIDKAIELGYNVCIWPESIKYKDVNDMVMSGMSSEEIRNIITNNTFSGLKAKLTLVKWSKL